MLLSPDIGGPSRGSREGRVGRGRGLVAFLSLHVFLAQDLLPCLCGGAGLQEAVPWGRDTEDEDQGGLTMPMNSISVWRSCLTRFLCW